MLFNTFEFLIFFLLVVIGYFSLPFRWRTIFLLLASYYFYMSWRWEYGFLILFQTALNYWIGLRIAGETDRRRKKCWVALALIASLGILGYYKYYNFFNDSFAAMAYSMGMNYLVPHLKILLPVGISFYTFQTLSYTIDVYRGNCQSERNFPKFALYVAFFPLLLAGPIERASKFLPQFERQNHFDAERLISGIQLIIWGLFKKVVIADRLALYVNQIYGSSETASGSSLLLATYFFAFQIYCDFSGYSDMAIGLSRILGYDPMQNFNLPYLANRISDFWKRWHISLSSWFGDYVYIPLGGNREGKLKWGRNIMTVFLLSGLWHGANWTFVIWGGLHGIYYFLEAPFKRNAFLKKAWLRPLQILIVFNAVVFAWIFFRATSISQAFTIIERIFTNFGRLNLGASQITIAISVLLILLLIVIQLLQYFKIASLYLSPSRFPGWMRLVGYVSLLTGVALLGVSNNEFIYFQF